MKQEISSKRTDLLHDDTQATQPTNNKKEEQQTSQSIQSRKEELEKKQQDIESQQDILKKELSTIEREKKGINLFQSGRVEIIDDDAAKVQSQNGEKEYLVNCKEKTCQCKDHENRGKYGIICMHRIAEKLQRAADKLKNPKKEDTSGITFVTMCN